MSTEGNVQSHAQASKPGQERVKLHICCLTTVWPLESYLLSLRVSLLTRKIGIENLRGKIVRINRNSVVSMVTVSAQWSLGSQQILISLWSFTHTTLVGWWTCRPPLLTPLSKTLIMLLPKAFNKFSKTNKLCMETGFFPSSPAPSPGAFTLSSVQPWSLLSRSHSRPSH